MTYELTLTCDSLDPDGLQSLTRDFRDALNDRQGLRADLVEGEAAPGERGDPAVLGQLALDLLGSVAANLCAMAIIETCLYIWERRPEAKIKIRRITESTLTRESVTGERYTATVKTVTEMFEDD